jgi:kinesin family protein 2/24
MDAPKILVAIRKRPLTRKETRRSEQDIIDCISPSSLVVKEPRVKVDLTKYIECHNFSFDRVYDETLSNEQIY